jgi:hypothetical protein
MRTVVGPGPSDQLRSAFGAGSAGAAFTSLVTAGVDMSLLDEGTFDGAAFGAGIVPVGAGMLVSAAGVVVIDGCCMVCEGVVFAGSVVVCAET